jgi:hypothetical protein
MLFLMRIEPIFRTLLDCSACLSQIRKMRSTFPSRMSERPRERAVSGCASKRQTPQHSVSLCHFSAVLSVCLCSRNSCTCFFLLRVFIQQWFKCNSNKIIFAILFHCWRETKMESFYSWEEKIWSTENIVRPSRGDTDRVLIITIDVNLGDGGKIRTSFVLWSFKKSQNARSVVFIELLSTLEFQTSWTNWFIHGYCGIAQLW